MANFIQSVLIAGAIGAAALVLLLVLDTIVKASKSITNSIKPNTGFAEPLFWAVLMLIISVIIAGIVISMMKIYSLPPKPAVVQYHPFKVVVVKPSPSAMVTLEDATGRLYPNVAVDAACTLKVGETLNMLVAPSPVTRIVCAPRML